MPDALPPPGAALSASDLNAHYGRAHILFDVTLSVRRGEVMALLGRNGAGKSTTMKAMMGIVRPTAGEVTFEGARIEREPIYRISRRGLGYVPEERRIFTELTVLENLEIGRRPARGALAWTPERIFAIFPNLGEMRNRPGGRMSGGEQQMLAIARTLMGNPSLILLDEPSEGLSPKIVEGLASTILELRREGLTVVISEQNIHFAQLVADSAAIIEKGRIRYSGSMAELSRDEGMQSEYLSV
jgi:branched-chain amino acid transport system ATP-binding protein